MSVLDEDVNSRSPVCIVRVKLLDETLEMEIYGMFCIERDQTQNK